MDASPPPAPVALAETEAVAAAESEADAKGWIEADPRRPVAEAKAGSAEREARVAQEDLRAIAMARGGGVGMGVGGVVVRVEIG